MRDSHSACAFYWLPNLIPVFHHKPATSDLTKVHVLYTVIKTQERVWWWCL